MPVDIWEALLEQAEDELDLALAQQRAAGPGSTRRSRADLDTALRLATEAAHRLA